MPTKPSKPTKPAKRVVKRPEGTTALNINLPSELMKRLDRWVEKLNAEAAGPRWTRTDVIRTWLARGLDERGDKGEAP